MCYLGVDVAQAHQMHIHQPFHSLKIFQKYFILFPFFWVGVGVGGADNELVIQTQGNNFASTSDLSNAVHKMKENIILLLYAS